MEGTAAEAANAALLEWFDGHGRALAFRRTRDPYAVLVAEVMLQQTQVARVEPAWRRFMDRFPTPADLAAASPADAIRAWAGLGYYGRAVRLQRACIAIMRDHGGAVPGSVADLRRLPGIGRYTARAVAAIAFGIPLAAIDTNVGRVVRRFFALDGPSDRPAEVQSRADAWIDHARPDAWTHALMDVGATICGPREPTCPVCPLRGSCATAAAGPWSRPDHTGPGAARRRRVGPTAVAGSSRRFSGTRRWLRGRILARLREEPDGRWLAMGAPIGEHTGKTVREALEQLAADGLVELDGTGRARLPETPVAGP